MMLAFCKLLLDNIAALPFLPAQTPNYCPDDDKVDLGISYHFILLFAKTD